MNTKLPTRPKMDARINVVLPEDEKQTLFEVAKMRRLPVSEIVRRGIALMAQQKAA